jgi:dihydroorotate dehydrogenase (NAD+) catalytic subunit
MVELNISCPNVENGMEFAVDPAATEKVVAAVRKVFSRPMIAELFPKVTDIVKTAKAAEQGGADAQSLINSVVGTVVFIEPDVPVRIVCDLTQYLKKKKLKSVNKLVGKVRKYS